MVRSRTTVSLSPNIRSNGVVLLPVHTRLKPTPFDAPVPSKINPFAFSMVNVWEMLYRPGGPVITAGATRLADNEAAIAASKADVESVLSAAPNSAILIASADREYQPREPFNHNPRTSSVTRAID